MTTVSGSRKERNVASRERLESPYVIPTFIHCRLEAPEISQAETDRLQGTTEQRSLVDKGLVSMHFAQNSTPLRIPTSRLQTSILLQVDYVKLPV